MSILIGSLLRLPHLYPLVQEVDSLIVLFFELCLEALVLHVLEATHLELIVGDATGSRRRQPTPVKIIALSVSNRVDVETAVVKLFLLLLLLGTLTVLRELDVVLVEDDLLDIVRRRLPHEQRVLRAFLVTLQDLVLVAEELQDLLEHGRRDRALHRQRARHLRCRLLREHLERLGALAELLELSKDLLCLALELLLQHFYRLLVVQLLFHDGSRLVSEQSLDLVEEILRWTRTMLKVHAEAVL